jgi:hypothetical protein
MPQWRNRPELRDVRERRPLPSLADFDRYVDQHGIPEEDYPAAFALWIAERTGGPVPRFEKVERTPPADGVVIEGDDQTLEGFASVVLASDAHGQRCHTGAISTLR